MRRDTGFPVADAESDFLRARRRQVMSRLAAWLRREPDDVNIMLPFHEVVEADKLLATAISYARCITPDCNTAYAMSKKALQDSVMRQIEERTVGLDEYLPAGMSDEGNRRAQDRRRQEIMHKRKG